MRSHLGTTARMSCPPQCRSLVTHAALYACVAAAGNSSNGPFAQLRWAVAAPAAGVAASSSSSYAPPPAVNTWVYLSFFLSFLPVYISFFLSFFLSYRYIYFFLSFLPVVYFVLSPFLPVYIILSFCLSFILTGGIHVSQDGGSGQEEELLAPRSLAPKQAAFLSPVGLQFQLLLEKVRTQASCATTGAGATGAGAGAGGDYCVRSFANQSVSTPLVLSVSS